MAKVICLCGRLCSGKSTYAKTLRAQTGAVILSTDELMLTVIGPDAGEMHDEYARRIKGFLLAKASEMVQAGVNVILDEGFWTKAERARVRTFFTARAVPCEFHYLEIDDETWKARIAKRNAALSAGTQTAGEQPGAYYVDEGLMKKFESMFEPPEPGEIDLWVKG